MLQYRGLFGVAFPFGDIDLPIQHPEEKTTKRACSQDTTKQDNKSKLYWFKEIKLLLKEGFAEVPAPT